MVEEMTNYQFLLSLSI